MRRTSAPTPCSPAAPVEDELARYRREAEAAAQQHAEVQRRFRERSTEARLAARVSAQVLSRTRAEAQALIAAKKDVVIAAVGEALCERFQQDREDATAELNAEVKALRLELAQLETVLAELRAVGGSGKVLDMPNFLRSVN